MAWKVVYDGRRGQSLHPVEKPAPECVSPHCDCKTQWPKPSWDNHLGFRYADHSNHWEVRDAALALDNRAERAVPSLWLAHMEEIGRPVRQVSWRGAHGKIPKFYRRRGQEQ